MSIENDLNLALHDAKILHNVMRANIYRIAIGSRILTMKKALPTPAFIEFVAQAADSVHEAETLERLAKAFAAAGEEERKAMLSSDNLMNWGV